MCRHTDKITTNTTLTVAIATTAIGTAIATAMMLLSWVVADVEGVADVPVKETALVDGGPEDAIACDEVAGITDVTIALDTPIEREQYYCSLKCKAHVLWLLLTIPLDWNCSELWPLPY